jgi:hypothetical protein
VTRPALSNSWCRIELYPERRDTAVGLTGHIETVGHLISGPGDDLVGKTFGEVQNLISVFDYRPKAVNPLIRGDQRQEDAAGSRRYERSHAQPGEDRFFQKPSAR